MVTTPPPPPPPGPPATANSTAAAPQLPKPPFTTPPPPPPLSTAATVKTETPPTTAAAAAATEDSSYTITVPSYSAWFSYDTIHETERRLMPEFFSEEAVASACRGPSAYKYYRDTIVRRFRARPGRRLTLTEARRGLVGDAGSVRRVFDFLEEWGLINYGASPTGTKPVKEKKEEVAVVAPVPATRKLCTGCRTVCGLAYFACEKVVVPCPCLHL